MTARRGVSLRSKFILIVLGGAVLPLALFGLRLAGTAERSAEALLRARLDASLVQIVDAIGSRWLPLRSQLLSLCESDPVQTRLRETSVAPNSDGRSVDDLDVRSGEIPSSLKGNVTFWTLRDLSETIRWASGPHTLDPSAERLADPVLPVRLDVYDNGTGELRGSLEAHLRVGSLLPSGVAWGGVSGSVLAAFAPESGTSLMPLSIDPSLFEQERFVWRGEPWLAERRTLTEPALVLALVAPLTPFLEPYEQVGRRNLLLLAIVAVGGTLLATVLSWPVTRSLRQLATAAECVSRGDLERRVEADRSDEVGRVARAFNTMTESLQRTLKQLSQREALASVGEFAASLAHEVRNPLTSIRVDLQRIEEALPEDSETRDLLQRALSQVTRVDKSVSGALRVARSGRIEREPVDVRQPLEAAAHEAGPAFAESRGILEPPELGADPIWVAGNAAALEQLFLNLLLNAAEALVEGDRAGVEVKRREETLRVTVWDTGRGIAPENLDRVFDPFYSTRPEGTGLGLAIAQRIAAAHGTELLIESVVGAGTRVELELPTRSGPTSKHGRRGSATNPEEHLRNATSAGT